MYTMATWAIYTNRVGKCMLQGLKWGAIFHCVLEYGGDIVKCTGPSMEPTIQSEDRILTERISSHCGTIPRNSIVISKSPSDPKYLICKRVIAVAGDEVILEEGSHTTIPKGHVWVEGDNTDNSLDSRSYGPIPVGLIKGRVIFRIWPPSGIGTLPAPS